MPRLQQQVPLEDSIAATLGALYEKKERGTRLIRVLEDYRRFQANKKTSHRTTPGGAVSATIPGNQLERLYLRRAAVDQVIRSIEAYSTAPSASAHR